MTSVAEQDLEDDIARAVARDDVSRERAAVIVWTRRLDSWGRLTAQAVLAGDHAYVASSAAMYDRCSNHLREAMAVLTAKNAARATGAADAGSAAVPVPAAPPVTPVWPERPPRYVPPLADVRLYMQSARMVARYAVPLRTPLEVLRQRRDGDALLVARLVGNRGVGDGCEPLDNAVARFRVLDWLTVRLTIRESESERDARARDRPRTAATP